MESRAPAPDDAPPPVIAPDVQKAFWLRGELVDRYNELLASRRKSDPKYRERQLLNEAVEMLLNDRSYGAGFQDGYKKGRARDR